MQLRIFVKPAPPAMSRSPFLKMQHERIPRGGDRGRRSFPIRQLELFNDTGFTRI
jgi:hypothetical protein